jgi:hypothetical protein
VLPVIQMWHNFGVKSVHDVMGFDTESYFFMVNNLWGILIFFVDSCKRENIHSISIIHWEFLDLLDASCFSLRILLCSSLITFFQLPMCLGRAVQNGASFFLMWEECSNHDGVGCSVPDNCGVTTSWMYELWFHTISSCEYVCQVTQQENSA